MAAEVFTLGLDKSLAGDVKRYFDTYGVLPPGDLVINGTTTPKGPTSFATLLKAMAKSAYTVMVVVVHGFSDGSGIYLKLAHTKKGMTVGTHTTAKALERLLKIGGRIDGSITADDRMFLGLEDDQINQLLDLMHLVRARHLWNVEFRGCNLGRSDASLNVFREFLGTRRFAAPNLHSFFGNHPLGLGQHFLDTHKKSHAGTMYTYESKFADKVFLNCIQINEEKKPKAGHSVASDLDTVNAWIAANVNATKVVKKSKTLPMHGLWELPTINTSDPLGGIDLDSYKPRPIFPMDPEFKKHIRAAIGSNQVGMRKLKQSELIRFDD